MYYGISTIKYIYHIVYGIRMNVSQTQITQEEAQQIALTARSQIFVVAPELQVFVKQTTFDADGTLQLRLTKGKQ